LGNHIIDTNLAEHRSRHVKKKKREKTKGQKTATLAHSSVRGKVKRKPGNQRPSGGFDFYFSRGDTTKTRERGKKRKEATVPLSPRIRAKNKTSS